MASGSAPRLHPQGMGELLDVAVRICTRNPGPLVRAVLVVLVPIQVISAVILATTVSDPDALSLTATTVGTEDDTAFLVGQIAVAVLSSLAVLLATGASFHAVAQAWLGRTPDWRASVRFALGRAGALLWIALIYAIGVAAGLVLCIAPGIWIAVAWSVAFPVLFLEGVGGPKALGRSYGLVQNRWWPSFGILLVGFLLAGIMGAMFTFVVGLLTLVDDSLGVVVAASALGSLVASAITTPVQAAIVTVLYFDLRIRKDRLDPAHVAACLEGAEVAEPLETQAPAGWLPPRPEISGGPRSDEA